MKWHSIHEISPQTRINPDVYDRRKFLNTIFSDRCKSNKMEAIAFKKASMFLQGIELLIDKCYMKKSSSFFLINILLKLVDTTFFDIWRPKMSTGLQGRG